MVRVARVADIKRIIAIHGFDNFINDLVDYLKLDFMRFADFDKSPRHATHVDGGVIELMPIADERYYSFKYVNGHPKNTHVHLQTVVATGQLSLVENGYPLFYSEMTVLTALRTAATAILAADVLARKNSTVLAIIGTGAQSEFQLRAHLLIRDIRQVKYYDTDLQAMHKFAKNMEHLGVELIPCCDVHHALKDADIVIVCTACKGHVKVVEDSYVVPGMHINGLGGDCPGKTELDVKTLLRSKIVVEYLPQSIVEGEIQLLNSTEIDRVVHGELWELLSGHKESRIDDQEITIFDSVGFALEDYSVLRLAYDLALKYNIGQNLDLVPDLIDPKNLITIL